MPRDDWARAKRSDIARRASKQDGPTTHDIYVKWKASRKIAPTKTEFKPINLRSGKIDAEYMGKTPCKIYFDSTVNPLVRIELTEKQWIW